jgi:hypothetical protein
MRVRTTLTPEDRMGVAPLSALRRSGSKATPLLVPRNDERGQVVVLVALVLVVLLGAAALVIDVGRAYVAKRHLQASADAAATAGALELPDSAAAVAYAREYSGRGGAKNHDGRLPAVTATVTTRCVSSYPCHPVNAIVVEQRTVVPTIFARVLGIDEFTIRARATALMGQGVPKPANVIIVYDRTNSMNDPCSAGGSKMTCVRDGVLAFLGAMDPKYNRVGLVVYPPGNGGAPCAFTPKGTDGPTTDYDAFPNGYLVVPLSTDYKIASTGALNPSSSLVSTVGCLKAHGTTATAPAIDRAQAVLAANHDPDVQDVIIFLTDGEANYGPCTDANRDQICENNTSPYRARPCRQAVTSAQSATAAGTWVYGIAYDTGGVQCWGWRSTGTGTDGRTCNKLNGYQFRCAEQPAITAHAAVQQIASDPTKFFFQPNPGDLTTIFERIAEDLTGPILIPDDYGN